MNESLSHLICDFSLENSNGWAQTHTLFTFAVILTLGKQLCHCVILTLVKQLCHCITCLHHYEVKFRTLNLHLCYIWGNKYPTLFDILFAFVLLLLCLDVISLHQLLAVLWVSDTQVRIEVMLGIEPGSFWRAASDPNRWVISPVPIFSLLECNPKYDCYIKVVREKNKWSFPFN